MATIDNWEEEFNKESSFELNYYGEVKVAGSLIDFTKFDEAYLSRDKVREFIREVVKDAYSKGCQDTEDLYKDDALKYRD